MYTIDIFIIYHTTQITIIFYLIVEILNRITHVVDIFNIEMRFDKFDYFKVFRFVFSVFYHHIYVENEYQTKINQAGLIRARIVFIRKLHYRYSLWN